MVGDCAFPSPAKRIADASTMASQRKIGRIFSSRERLWRRILSAMTQRQADTFASSKVRHRQTIKAAASGWIGSALEFYDFFIYATAASLVFPQLFFPVGDP